MKLQDCETKRLLPAFMREEKDVAALADALDPIIRQIGQLLPLMSDWESIDDLPEEALDLLAKELSIDWYKRSEPIDVKRRVIAGSDKVHKILGTVEAVRQVAASFYGDANIEEWYEYDGLPGHFRISVLEHGGSMATPDELYDLISKVKRAGAIMDGVDFSWENYLSFFAAIATHSAGKSPDVSVPVKDSDLEWEAPASSYAVFLHFQTYQRDLFITPTPSEAEWGGGLGQHAAMRHKQSYVQNLSLAATGDELEWKVAPINVVPGSVETYTYRYSLNEPISLTPEESEAIWGTDMNHHAAMHQRQSYLQTMRLSPTPSEAEWTAAPINLVPGAVDTFTFRSHATLAPSSEEKEWSATLHEHTKPTATLVTTLPEINITP